MKAKICYACGAEKPRSAFHKHRGRRDGLNDVCKSCHTKRVSIYSQTEGAKLARARFFAAYKELPAVRKKLQKYSREYQANLSPKQRDKYLESRYRRQDRDPRHRLYGMLYSAAKRRPTDDIATIEDLMEMWRLQDGRCALSGIKMTWVSPDKSGKKLPTSISIDRIDPEKGYEKSNIRLVCWQANMFKNEWSDDQMFAMALAIVTNMRKPKLRIVA